VLLQAGRSVTGEKEVPESLGESSSSES
jgi:hypothetical protein